MTATILDRAPLLDGFYRIARLKLRLPDGAEVERLVEDHGAAATVLPYDPLRRTALLVTQPRAAVLDAGCAPLLETIAGKIETDAEDTARNEALEEAGVRLDALERVGEVWTMCVFSRERVTLFLARYAASDRIAAGGGAADEHENITVHEVPLAELRARRIAGALDDVKTLLLVQALELREPALFADAAAR